MMPAVRVEPVVERTAGAAWSLPTRVLFRFCTVYFSLYVLLTQMLPTLIVPGIDAFDGLDTGTPVKPIVSWTAAHVFRVTTPLVVTGSGSGDKTFDWVEAFCLLVVALAVAAIWSVADRARREYTTLHTWFHLFMRFALGSTMFVYGFTKIVPLQMPYPGLSRLVEPFGNFSPMGVLWASIGASPAYEICTGTDQIVRGMLVMIPRTSLIGAIVCAFDVTQIFALNMTYDVPVKLFSFHLLLFTFVTMAPHHRRLYDFFIGNRPAGASPVQPLFRGGRANRVALGAQLIFIVYLTAMNLQSDRTMWTRFGGGASKSPLYGLWNVQRLSVDGRAPDLFADSKTWRRVIFERPGFAGLQQVDDTIVRFGASFGPGQHTLLLNKSIDKSWHAQFTYDQPDQDRLVLDGTMDGHVIHAELRLVDPSTFLLVSRGFHWIQEFPFNR